MPREFVLYDDDLDRAVELDGMVTTLTGAETGFVDGSLAAARFSGPGALARAQDGTLYVGDRFNSVIRRISPAGEVTTIAGNGTRAFADAVDPLLAAFHSIEGIELSADERFLYIADGSGGMVGVPYHRIRRLAL